LWGYSPSRPERAPSGSDKCRYITEELRIDAAIDIEVRISPKQLAAACPKGIDVYFKNVSGAVWQAVLPLFLIPLRACRSAD
jgi:NADPH-dependent curcumin reductase CurA